MFVLKVDLFPIIEIPPIKDNNTLPGNIIIPMFRKRFGHYYLN
jgi:hypothetical protein